jgi:hypothetical protein
VAKTTTQGSGTGTQQRSRSDAGAPAGTTQITDDTPLRLMKEEDRQAVLARIGYTAYRERLQREMRGVKVQIRRR